MKTPNFNDSTLEGIVDKYSWTFPNQFIYVALIHDKKQPPYVYEHIYESDAVQGFKKYPADSLYNARLLFNEMKNMYNIEWDKQDDCPNPHGQSE